MNKPVAYWDGKHYASKDKSSLADIPLYTHPAELTDEEINIVGIKTLGSIWNCYDEELVDFARAILRKAQEK